MESEFMIECQFVSAGFNLKQWDLVKSKSLHGSSIFDFDVYKSTGTEFLIPLDSANRQPFSSIVFDPCGENIASLIVNNQELYISTLKEGMGFKKIPLNFPHCITYVGLDSKFLVVGCTNSLCLVDCQIPKVVEIIPLPKLGDRLDKIITIDSSYDPLCSNFIVIGTELGQIYSYRCFRDKNISKHIVTKDIPINNIKLSPHLYHIVATSHSNGNVSIWDMDKKILIHSIFPHTSSLCVCLDFSPFRDDLLGIGRIDGIICLYDLKKQTIVGQLSIPKSTITGLIFLKNGINLIVGDNKGQIHIYNLRTLQSSRTYRLHSSTLKVLALKRNKYPTLNEEYILENTTKSNSLKQNDRSHKDISNLLQNNNDFEKSSQNSGYSLTNPRYDTKDLNKNCSIPREQPILHNTDIISPLRTINLSPKDTNPNPLNYVPHTEIATYSDFSSRNSSSSIANLHEPVNNAQKNICSTSEFTGLSSLDKSLNVIDCLNMEKKSNDVDIREGKTALPKALSSIDPLSKHSQDPLNSKPSKTHVDTFLSTLSNNRGSTLTDSPISNYPVENNYLSTILDTHLIDIKEYFCQNMIILMSENTRNVTNLQFQISSLNIKMDALQDQITDIKNKISNNPHLL